MLGELFPFSLSLAVLEEGLRGCLDHFWLMLPLSAVVAPHTSRKWVTLTQLGNNFDTLSWSIKGKKMLS